MDKTDTPQDESTMPIENTKAYSIIMDCVSGVDYDESARRIIEYAASRATPTPQLAVGDELRDLIEDLDGPYGWRTDLERLIQEATEQQLQPIPMVNGLDCSACGNPTLILGNGGYITCSLEDCPNPDYAESSKLATERAEVEARIKLLEYLDQTPTNNVVNWKGWIADCLKLARGDLRNLTTLDKEGDK